MLLRIVSAIALASVSVPLAAQEPAATKESSIPFISRDGILNFRADGNQAVWIQSYSGKWYRVTLMQRCIGLAGALSLGFQTSAGDQLDNHGAILVQGRRCPIQNLVRSEAPPKRVKHRL